MTTMPSFDAARWRVLSPYLDAALDMPTEEWGRLIGSIGSRDASLAAGLQMLLAEREAIRGSGFLDRLPSTRFVPRPRSLAGEVFSGYQLVSQIGQGGMGSVWLAERRDGGFDRRAAVKLLNMSWLGHATEQRFHREGAILSRLDHPHIARLIDAGVSPAGQPYLVLEHVDGKPMDRYSDEHRLGIDERLRLFLDVLDAVTHAHAHLVVHRDIKPDNVLVSTTGQVKLLDFGIAKLLAGDAAGGPSPAADLSTLTREGSGMLTLKYAAPEQLTGGPVTEVTDVYALGVLLYELLTGQHPAGPPGQPPGTLVRAIVDREPERMSDVVTCRTESEQVLIRHAARRGTSPIGLRLILKRDLDSIVAKALKRNPFERYVSANALAEDIRRYLRRERIRTRRFPLSDRTAAFIRRAVAAAAAHAAVVSLHVSERWFSGPTPLAAASILPRRCRGFGSWRVNSDSLGYPGRNDHLVRSSTSDLRRAWPLPPGASAAVCFFSQQARR